MFVTFISDFYFQVGIHELLGHGSGKLYHSNTDDAKALVASGKLHPLTKEPITGPFYQPGSTWDTTFGSLASTYEVSNTILVLFIYL